MKSVLTAGMMLLATALATHAETKADPLKERGVIKGDTQSKPEQMDSKNSPGKKADPWKNQGFITKDTPQFNPDQVDSSKPLSTAKKSTRPRDGVKWEGPDFDAAKSPVAPSRPVGKTVNPK